MLNEIVPEGVASAASRIDLDIRLFPEEERSIGRAVEKRQREFRTGRACARAALRELGVPPQAIPSGPEGAPKWPTGIVGSITHCSGYRACAVARQADLAAIGVDAEPNKPLPAGVLSTIALPQERERVIELTREMPDVNWDRLLFCMKEAIFKAWFPLTGQRLGFEDALIAIDPPTERFEVQPLTDLVAGHPNLADFSGRWIARDELLVTSFAHPAPRSTSASP